MTFSPRVQPKALMSPLRLSLPNPLITEADSATMTMNDSVVIAQAHNESLLESGRAGTDPVNMTSDIKDTRVVLASFATSMT